MFGRRELSELLYIKLTLGLLILVYDVINVITFRSFIF